jgi:hypothetical protein
MYVHHRHQIPGVNQAQVGWGVSVLPSYPSETPFRYDVLEKSLV